MAENSGIEWTDHTFNPWVGCTKISPACDHCYAEGWAKRTGNGLLWQGKRRRTSAANWSQPRKWQRQAAAAGKRAKVFCASLADVFDNQADPAWRCDLWDLIYETPDLDWLLLTKRPQNIRKMLPEKAKGALSDWGVGWPNVWLGTTVENQEEAERRIPHLREVPARIRFLSCEPMVSPVTLTVDHLIGLDWIIAGGESGPGARPMHPTWARSLRDQCQTAGIWFFFKQWGEWAPWDVSISGWAKHLTTEGVWIDGIAERANTMFRVGKKAAGALLDGREWREFPGEMEARDGE